jgi:NAD(P)-dependent dehydrogenase (short-subunit alcohol dehydrogenase family)
MKIAGAVALVTGGASGLGEATARRLSSAGARVLIVDRDEQKGRAVAGAIGGGYAKADVTSEADLQAAVAEAHQLGPLRIAVGCAGVGWAARTLSKDGTPHEIGLFQTVVGINLIGMFNMVRLCAAQMAKNDPTDEGERGVCVQTASVAAFDGQIGQAAYAASKAGVVGLTLPLARDLSPVGIRVCTIAPGTFDTPMMAMLPEPAKQALAANIPFPRRLGRPDEYAQLVQSIAENPYLNGETIRLDGALRMPPK